MSEDSSNPQDLMLQNSLLAVLRRHYPGHFWHVDVNVRQGMINIHNLFLSGIWGFRIHLKGIHSASQIEHDVKMAGGELLERYNMRRGSFNVDKWEGLPMDFSGQIIMDRG